MKYYFRILMASIITLFLVTSCDEDEGSQDESIQINLEKSQLKPFELALIEINTELSTQELYEGFVDNELILLRSKDNHLIFQVPEGVTGQKNGTININGEEYNFQYELISNSFTNAETYLQNYFLEEQFKQLELENLMDAFVQDSIPGFENIQTDMAIWEQIATNSENEIATLSTTDKEKLAKLIDANSDWIQRIYDALLLKSIYSMNRASASDCRALIERGRIELQEDRLFASAATSIEAYYCSLTFDERQYDDLTNDFDKGALLLSDTEFTGGLDALNTLANVVFRKMDAFTKELQGSMSSNGVAEEIENAENRMDEVITFKNGEPEKIFAKIKFRSINQNDIDTEGVVGQAATFFDKVITSYDQAVTAISDPLIWRPGFTQTLASKDFNQFLTIESSSISNSEVVLITTQYVDDNWEVAFGNDGNQEQPSFTFELNYDDGYVQLNKTVSALITDSLIIGTWSLIDATNNGTSFFDPTQCDNLETEIYTATQLTATSYYDSTPGSMENDCLASETIVSDYIIENGILYDTYQGDTDESEILELNNETLILKSIDGPYTYIFTYARQ